jgi:hypothetical protein
MSLSAWTAREWKRAKRIVLRRSRRLALLHPGRRAEWQEKVRVRRSQAVKVAMLAIHRRAGEWLVARAKAAQDEPTHELWEYWPDTGWERTGKLGVPGVTQFRRAMHANYEWRPIPTLPERVAELNKLAAG